MDALQVFSIILECVIVILCLAIGIAKKKPYGYGLALTFCIYVFYDASKLFSFNVTSNVLNPMFLIATLSALVSIWSVFRQ